MADAQLEGAWQEVRPFCGASELDSEDLSVSLAETTVDGRASLLRTPGTKEAPAPKADIEAGAGEASEPREQ